MDVPKEKAEAKRLQEVRKLRKDEEMAWPDWEESRKMEDGDWRLEPEGGAEVPEIIICRMQWKATPVDPDAKAPRAGRSKALERLLAN